MRALSSAYFALFVVVALRPVCSGGENPVYVLRAKPETFRVDILALSMSIHSGGEGEEVYLANIAGRGHPPELAKLVDSYTLWGPPILRSVLTERHPLKMKLVRNPQCDGDGQTFFLPPGSTNIFDASTRDVLNSHATDTIRCFSVIHNATRLTK